MANCAMITITRGSVSAKQLENEFRGQSGPHSTWRWFAKRISDNVFQMRFPIAKKIDDIASFAGMEMSTVPNVSFKVEKWNANAGAKAGLDTAWFRILGIPLEKRSEHKVCYVAYSVGLPLEVDKGNLKRWDL